MEKSEKKDYFFTDLSLWSFISKIFVGSRIILLLTAWFSAYFSGNADYQRYIEQGFFLSPKWLIDIWCRWDSEWLLSIVKWGYVAPKDLSGGYSNLAFFPLYPYLIRVLTFWIPIRFQTESFYLLLGLIISNFCLFLALYGLAKLSEKLFSIKTGRSIVMLMLCLPCGFYFSAFYGESLFLFLIIYTMILAENEKWCWCAIFAAAAALCRPHGVLIIIPAAFTYLSKRNWNLKKIGSDWIWFFLVPAVICGYFLCLYNLTGDFFAFFKAQASWGRSLTDTSAFSQFFEPLYSRHNRTSVIDLVFICFSLIISIVMIIRSKYKAYGFYALVCTLVLIGTGNLYSMMRYTAVIYPVWTYIADILKNRKNMFGFLCAVFLSLQILLFCGWINYYWIA